jgi:hypothetical protein
MPTGTVKWFDSGKGFGFVTRSEPIRVLSISAAIEAALRHFGMI